MTAVSSPDEGQADHAARGAEAQPGRAVSGRFAHGLVIGTFYPPHVGHLALIRAALSACDRVTVEVLGASTESLPVPLRVEWLREEVPTARLAAIVDDAEIDFESATAWDHHTAVIRALLDPADGPVAAVFTSDPYGEELARRLSATWVRVDPGRSALTVSSTAVRSDVAAQWWALPAPVRQHLAKRVVVVGAEPTETSALAAALAAHFEVPCVSADGRDRPDLRRAEIESPWQSRALDLMAAEQVRLEDAAARRSPRPLLVCASDVLAMAVTHEHQRGSRAGSLEAVAQARVPALYLLTVSDGPLARDGAGARDGADGRRSMTGRFREMLDDQPATWVEVSGPWEARLADGIRAVEEVLAAGWGLAPSLEQQQQAARAAPAADGPPAGAVAEAAGAAGAGG